MTSQLNPGQNLSTSTKWLRVAVLTLFVAFCYSLFGSFSYDQRPTWMPWTWLIGWHSVWVALLCIGMLRLMWIWGVPFSTFIIATAGIIFALPFFWLMPRLYFPLDTGYSGIAIVYADTYPDSKAGQAKEAEGGLYTKQCLSRERRKWAKNPSKLDDMKVVSFFTSQAGVAYGYWSHSCDVGFTPPRTFADNVTLALTTGPLVIMELMVRALWGWYLPLMAAQIIWYKWKKELIWEARLW